MEEERKKDKKNERMNDGRYDAPSFSCIACGLLSFNSPYIIIQSRQKGREGIRNSLGRMRCAWVGGKKMHCRIRILLGFGDLNQSQVLYRRVPSITSNIAITIPKDGAQGAGAIVSGEACRISLCYRPLLSRRSNRW